MAAAPPLRDLLYGFDRQLPLSTGLSLPAQGPRESADAVSVLAQCLLRDGCVFTPWCGHVCWHSVRER